MKKYLNTEYYITECGKIFRNNKELKPSITNKGYKTYRASINNKLKHISIHRAVAQLYVPNPENKPQVNHKDGDKLNNHYTNLEWVTNQENKNHAKLHNLYAKGSDMPHSKLTEEDVKWIRDYYIPKDPNFGGVALSKKYGVGESQISRIINNKRWKHL